MSQPRLNIAMDISGTCNLRCKMCYFSLPGYRSKERLPLEVFESICAQVGRSALSLSLSFGAEPLIVKNFPRYLEAAKRHGVRNVWFVSNGTLLTPELSAAIIENDVKYIAFSVDGASKETYETIRRGAKWEDIVRNLDTLAQMKRERGSKTPYLNFHYLLFKSNYQEFLDFIELASTWDAKEVNVGFPVEHEGIDLSGEGVSIDEVADVLREATTLARKKGMLLTGSNVQLIPAWRKIGYYLNVAMRRTAMRGFAHTWAEVVTKLSLRRTKCQYLHRYVFFDAAGDVRPCCLWFADEPLGNVRTDAFADVWARDNYTLLRTADPAARARAFASCKECRSGVLRDGTT